MSPNAATMRRVQRRMHLVAGGLLLTYVYLPIPVGVEHAVQFIAIPMLVATGVAMWQAGRLRRFRRRFAVRTSR